MSGRTKIDLRITRLSELTPHEETVSRLSERLVRRMIQDGVQRDPIIIDLDSKIILDGMHRAMALQMMGARSAVCYTLDYMSEETKLFSWFRFVENPGEELVRDVVEELGASKAADMPVEASAPESGFLLTFKGKAYTTERSPTLDDVADAARTFDSVVARHGAWVRYMDESSASPDLLRGAYMMLLVPRIPKEDVVRQALDGSLFPPKTTLHVFPARPMGINYPISFLRDGTDVLERMVASKKRRLIEAPSFYRGRLYREPVVVFE